MSSTAAAADQHQPGFRPAPGWRHNKNRTYPFAATEAGVGHGFPERVAGIALLDFSREHRFNAALAALKKSGSWDGESIELTSAFVFDVKSLGFATLIQQNLDLLFRFCSAVWHSLSV